MSNHETPAARRGATHTAGRCEGRGLVDPPSQAVLRQIPTIDPESFTPRLLALVSNALVWRESTLLRQQLGLGTNDWRVLSALAVHPGASATEVSNFLGLNKAVISKSVALLAGRGLVVLSEGPRGSRPLYMTPAGVEVHDTMLPLSTSGEDIILAGLDDDEVARFNEILRGMLARIRASALTENGAGPETEPQA